MTEDNFEAEGTTTPDEATESSNEALEANETQNGENNSQNESDDAKSKRQERAEFFQRKEELEKEYQEKLKSLESKDITYKESEESSKPVASDKLTRMERELAEVTLKTEGVTHHDDIEQLLEISDKMEMTPKEVTSLTWVQAMLKDNADNRRHMDATPSSSKRSGQKSAKDTVAYWVGRKDLPAKENKQLRRQVIHARENAQRKSQMFNN